MLLRQIGNNGSENDVEFTQWIVQYLRVGTLGFIKKEWTLFICCRGPVKPCSVRAVDMHAVGCTVVWKRALVDGVVKCDDNGRICNVANLAGMRMMRAR